MGWLSTEHRVLRVFAMFLPCFIGGLPHHEAIIEAKRK
jgi:hypothetical protein